MNEQLRMYDKNLFADWVRPEQLPARMEEIKKYGSDRVIYTLGKFREVFESAYTS